MSDSKMSAVESTVYSAVQLELEKSGIRSVFREIDLSDIKSNTYKFPIQRDEEPGEIVPEGAEMPRSGSDYDERQITFDKFGFEVTDETSESQIDKNAELLVASIANQAYSEIYDSVQWDWASADNRLDIVDTATIDAGSVVPFGKQDTVVVSRLMAECIEDSDPTREWDEIASDLSQKHSVTVVTDEYNLLRASDVLVADSDRFGFEGFRNKLDLDSYVEYEEHCPRKQIHIPEEEREIRQEVTRVYTRRGFIAMNNDKAYIARFQDL